MATESLELYDVLHQVGVILLRHGTSHVDVYHTWITVEVDDATYDRIALSVEPPAFISSRWEGATEIDLRGPGGEMRVRIRKSSHRGYLSSERIERAIGGLGREQGAPHGWEDDVLRRIRRANEDPWWSKLGRWMLRRLR